MRSRLDLGTWFEPRFFLVELVRVQVGFVPNVSEVRFCPRRLKVGVRPSFDIKISPFFLEASHVTKKPTKIGIALICPASKLYLNPFCRATLDVKNYNLSRSKSLEKIFYIIYCNFLTLIFQNERSGTRKPRKNCT